MAAVTFPVPDAEEREIAGVPVPGHPARGRRRVRSISHFHGGGMISGSAAMMDIPNQMLARELGVTVVSVEYRKAPEFPWPAGPDDGVAVARELLEQRAAEFGTERLLIGGESAGGYMAAAVALRVRDELDAIDRVAGLNLTYGIYDWGGTPSQRGRRPKDGFDMLSPEFVRLVADCFLPGRTDDERRAPEISPAYADLRGLPPCFVSVGTCDHLLDDSLLFAAACDGGRRERRPVRAARDAARVPDVRLRDHARVGELPRPRGCIRASADLGSHVHAPHPARGARRVRDVRVRVVHDVVRAGHRADVEVHVALQPGAAAHVRVGRERGRGDRHRLRACPAVRVHTEKSHAQTCWESWVSRLKTVTWIAEVRSRHSRRRNVRAGTRLADRTHVV